MHVCRCVCVHTVNGLVVCVDVSVYVCGCQCCVGCACVIHTHTWVCTYVRCWIMVPGGLQLLSPTTVKRSTCRAMFQIRRLTELDHLAGCSSLKQLFLADNPAVGYYKDFTALAGWEPSLHTVVCGSPEHCSGVRVWVWGGSCRCRTNTH